MAVRFTRKAQGLLLATRLEAERLQRSYVSTAHLLLAMLQADGPIGNILRLFGLQISDVQEVAQRLYIDQNYLAINKPELALDLKLVLSIAASEAHAAGKDSITSDSLFLTLLSQGTGHAIDILTEFNIRPASLHSEFQLGRGGGPPALNYIRWDGPLTLRFPAAMPERMSANAKRALALAKDAARQYGHPVITSAHLLIGLIDAEGQAQRVLTYLGLDSASLREALQRDYVTDRIWDGNSLEMGSDLAEVLVLSESEGRPGENAIGTGHLLLGITLPPRNVALDILKQFHVSASRIQGLVIRKVVAE